MIIIFLIELKSSTKSVKKKQEIQIDEQERWKSLILRFSVHRSADSINLVEEVNKLSPSRKSWIGKKAEDDFKKIKITSKIIEEFEHSSRVDNS